ncbi:MAG: universal stress protein [Gemmataceae bacterium]|nr:universal stress protein [Gemmataceae bacterium]MCS7271238.1 universal stress protein [Gemmataceae bacterium]MDW8241920.1 universal stress protein [Thermogemmata sp.]
MKPIRRILVPTDFGECSAPAVRLAAMLAERLQAELVLLHVVQDLTLALPDAVMPTPVPSPDLAEMIESAKQGLVNLIRTEQLEHLQPQTEIRVGSPVAEIVAAAKDLQADLLCIGTHGRTGLAHLLLGSQAERILREAPCPVLTVKPSTC